MKLIPLTQGKFAQVDDEDYDWLMQWKWHYHKGYAKRTVRIGKSWKTFFMHREIAKTPNGMITDHINENGETDGLNNQRYNLRNCTNTQNLMNARIYSNNKSGYKGVCWHIRDEIWMAYIRQGKKLKHLGEFSDPETAAKAYDKAAIELFGNFARLNFPKKP